MTIVEEPTKGKSACRALSLLFADEINRVLIPTSRLESFDTGDSGGR